MEPVSIGLLVAYVIIIAIALERSYRVHSLKLKYAASNKNTEDLVYEHRAFILATLRGYGVRLSGYGGTWFVSGVFNYDLMLLNEGNFYFNLNTTDGVLRTSCAAVPYTEVSKQALAVLCERYVDTYNNYVKSLRKNKTAKRNVTAKLASVKPVKCKIKKCKSPTEDVADSPESTTAKAPAKKKPPKYKAVKVSTKPVKVKIKK